MSVLDWRPRIDLGIGAEAGLDRRPGRRFGRDLATPDFGSVEQELDEGLAGSARGRQSRLASEDDVDLTWLLCPGGVDEGVVGRFAARHPDAAATEFATNASGTSRLSGLIEPAAICVELSAWSATWLPRQRQPPILPLFTARCLIFAEVTAPGAISLAVILLAAYAEPPPTARTSARVATTFA
ncbi:MAG: hypothetical protein U0R71_17395 [Solirubrobacterales bacterium]